MSKIITITLFIVLCMVIFSCTKKNKDKVVIKNFFLELTKSTPKDDSLYQKYFVTSTYDGQGRNIEDTRYYIDTILPFLKSKAMGKKVEILSLKEALNKYPFANFYRNYYDGQDKQIYICNFNSNPSDTNVVYILMFNNKIISTKPSSTIEGKIIQWF